MKFKNYFFFLSIYVDLLKFKCEHIFFYTYLSEWYWMYFQCIINHWHSAFDCNICIHTCEGYFLGRCENEWFSLFVGSFLMHHRLRQASFGSWNWKYYVMNLTYCRPIYTSSPRRRLLIEYLMTNGGRGLLLHGDDVDRIILLLTSQKLSHVWLRKFSISMYRESEKFLYFFLKGLWNCTNNFFF